MSLQRTLFTAVLCVLRFLDEMIQERLSYVLALATTLPIAALVLWCVDGTDAPPDLMLTSVLAYPLCMWFAEPWIRGMIRRRLAAAAMSEEPSGRPPRSLAIVAGAGAVAAIVLFAVGAPYELGLSVASGGGLCGLSWLISTMQARWSHHLPSAKAPVFDSAIEPTRAAGARAFSQGPAEPVARRCEP